MAQGKERQKGEMKCLLGDYFDDGWLGEVKGWKDGEGFDIIYDNTVSLLRAVKAGETDNVFQFLCALPPSMRPKWSARTASLLRGHNSHSSDGGVLICLEFPTHKPASSAGPPWSLPPTVHAELLKRPGEDISYDDKGVVVATDRPEARDALVRVAHYTPKRTHTVGVINGVVRDCVSVWRHKSDVQ